MAGRAERWLFDRASRVLLALASGMQLAGLACALWQLWLVGQAIGGVFLRGRALADVAGALLLAAALVAVRALLAALAELLAQRAASRVKQRTRHRLAAHLLALGPAYTQAQRGGSLLHVATEHIEALDEYVSQFLPARWLATAGPLLVLVAVGVVDPLTTLVLLFAGPILVVVLALIGLKTRDLTERRFAELRWMSAYFLDLLRGLATLKLFGRSHDQGENLEQIGERYRTTTMDVLRTAFQTSLVLEWGATAATALVALEVGWRLIMGLMAFEPALIVLLMTPEFFLPLRQLSLKYHAGTAGSTAAKEIGRMLAEPAPHSLGDMPVPVQHDITFDGDMPVPVQHDITFDDVHLAYRDGQPALAGCSFQIPHGSITAIVGPTGAGKSTLVNLLLGFVQPEGGQIWVANTRLDQIDQAAWREQIGFVPQHPHLFAGTVAENLRLGAPQASDVALETAARAANAHTFISSLPQGYATPLGENGARLSGGQRQRLALARALLRDAPLLVCDELTAHLDAENETLIEQALLDRASGRTMVLVTHRLRLAALADHVVLLEAGRVAATGSHAALLEQSAAYRNQFERYRETRGVA